MANELVKARISTDHFDIGELQKRLGGRRWPRLMALFPSLFRMVRSTGWLSRR
jgi:hypothetical protein